MSDIVDPAQPWPAQWLRGVLDLAVLAVISREQTYGYRISADLHDLGLGTVKGGTLYPLLARLEEAGAVEASWREGTSGPGRKWYSITALGRDRLQREGVRWSAFAQVTSGLLDEPAGLHPPGGREGSARRFLGAGVER